MKNIKEMSESKSVIVISHRLANVVPADNIYYMEEGEVKESGSHAQLMSAQGGYAKLFNTQKALEEGYKEITGATAEERAWKQNFAEAAQKSWQALSFYWAVFRTSWCLPSSTVRWDFSPQWV